jgi:inositol oxygenase
VHREGAYEYLLDPHDREMLPWVQKFNPYDLYSKAHERVSVASLRPYYENLIAEYFPPKLRW